MSWRGGTVEDGRDGTTAAARDTARACGWRKMTGLIGGDHQSVSREERGVGLDLGALTGCGLGWASARRAQRGRGKEERGKGGELACPAERGKQAEWRERAGWLGRWPTGREEREKEEWAEGGDGDFEHGLGHGLGNLRTAQYSHNKWKMCMN
uniref:Uncharacterized protein n=1 Tax=Oryza brachyantha TaxID=4533 RepID=J3N849_ORYBR